MKAVVMVVALASLGAGCAPVDYCGDGGVARDSALFASQTFVKERLRSPASAVFPTSSDGQGASVTKTGQCTFTVISHVDSQNGFGAMLRTGYIAKVTPDAAGRYKLDALVMD